MVSNVLSMRSIESGELEMHVAAFDPRDVVEDLLQARARMHILAPSVGSSFRRRMQRC